MVSSTLCLALYCSWSPWLLQTIWNNSSPTTDQPYRLITTFLLLVLHFYNYKQPYVPPSTLQMVFCTELSLLYMIFVSEWKDKPLFLFTLPCFGPLVMAHVLYLFTLLIMGFFTFNEHYLKFWNFLFQMNLILPILCCTSFIKCMKWPTCEFQLLYMLACQDIICFGEIWTCGPCSTQVSVWVEGYTKASMTHYKKSYP